MTAAPPERSWSAWLRSPVGLGILALTLLAVVVLVRGRAGGEAGAPYGLDEAADCVAVYPDALDERTWAFDGVVTGTGPSVTDQIGSIEGYAGVTFEVREWFAGDGGDVVTRDKTNRPAVGPRLLVAGEPRWGGPALDAPLAWDTCGFVRYFDPDVAQQWREQLSGD